MTLAEMQQYLSDVANTVTSGAQSYQQVYNATHTPSTQTPAQVQNTGGITSVPMTQQNKTLLIAGGIFLFIVGLFYFLRRG